MSARVPAAKTFEYLRTQHANAPITNLKRTMADPVNEADEDLLDYEDEEEAPTGASVDTYRASFGFVYPVS